MLFIGKKQWIEKTQGKREGQRQATWGLIQLLPDREKFAKVFSNSFKKKFQVEGEKSIIHRSGSLEIRKSL